MYICIYTIIIILTWNSKTQTQIHREKSTERNKNNYMLRGIDVKMINMAMGYVVEFLVLYLTR